LKNRSCEGKVLSIGVKLNIDENEYRSIRKSKGKIGATPSPRK